MLDKFPFLLHGGDYNPDQWRHVPGTVEEDFRLFKLAGMELPSYLKGKSPEKPVDAEEIKEEA